MQITGRNHLSVDPATAWAAFHDAGVLERSLPGCQSLREVAPGRFDMTVTAGVAAIKGTYDGQASFSQETKPESFVLSLSGAGGPGTVDADVEVRLSPADGGGTDLGWTADATVGGPVGGVGQRMLSSVARRLAGQFFTNIDRDLALGGAAALGAGPEEAAGAAAAGAVGQGALASSTDRSPSGGPSAGTPRAGMASTTDSARAADGSPVVQMMAGAAIALVGVALGARLRRR